MRPYLGSYEEQQAPAETMESYNRMTTYMSTDLRWSAGMLHDAVLILGAAIPRQPSLLCYFATLYNLASNPATAFLPQNAKTHTKAHLKDVLLALSAGGLKVGGVQGTKRVLAERLSAVLNWVIEHGRDVSLGGEDETNEAAVDWLGDEASRCESTAKPHIRALSRSYAEVPADAIVDPMQAESALGHNLADEIDADIADIVDKDVRAEEEAMLGAPVNPPGLPYDCLAPSPRYLFDHAVRFGLHPPFRSPTLTRAALAFSASDASHTLEMSVSNLQESFEQSLSTHGAEISLAAKVATLDPTQRAVYDTITQWAHRDMAKGLTSGQRQPLRMLVLGTAGTGKTHTLKCAIEGARRTLGGFHTVAVCAHTGIAAANLGGGASTIDSLFRLGGAAADEDLEGEKLDQLAERLSPVRLLVIDEVSTLGAAQMEMVSRRLEQVAEWRHVRAKKRAPDRDFGGFGGIAVVLTGGALVRKHHRI